MPGRQTRTVEEIYNDVCDRLGGVEHHGQYATAYCPAHDNTDTPALSVLKKDDGVTFKCHGQDCPRAEICKAIGIKEQDLYVDAPMAKVVRLKPKKNSGEAETEAPLGCTVEEYAEAKGVPADWLKQRFGLRDLKKHPRTGAAAVVIPYFDASGAEARTRYRLALQKPAEGPDPRFSWKTGSKADLLYGIEDLARYKEEGEAVILVEGESDRHTLVYHGFPALGVPGAQNTKAVRLEDFEGVETVYAVVETGEAGETFGRKLGEIFEDRLRLVEMKATDFEDVSEMHLADSEGFADSFERLLEESVSYTDQQKQGSDAAASKLWETCRELAESPDILAEFEKDIKEAGVVGQEREAKILYLAATSRYLKMPSSIIVKGPSGGGKSFVLNKMLDFHPEEAYYKLSAMSEKALAHFSEPLKHRHLVIAEAAALNNSEMAEYFVRTLLSEGFLHYVYPLPGEPGQPMVNHEIRVEGPTGLFITTTQQSVHQENETRLLSITVDDTKAQTRAVILGPDDEDEDDPGPDIARWHALQRWIAMAGEKRVRVPYRRWLGSWIPEAALGVRLRRDFTQIINLIRSHALLHQASRERDEKGRVVANVEDYRIVRSLLYDIIAEGLNASVRPTVRQAVIVLRRLYDELETKSDGVKIGQLSKALNLDDSAARRRISTAIRLGFAKNLETRDRQAARYAPADPLPADIVVLPEAEELETDLGTKATKATRANGADLGTKATATPPEGGVGEHTTAENSSDSFFTENGEDKYRGGTQEACSVPPLSGPASVAQVPKSNETDDEEMEF